MMRDANLLEKIVEFFIFTTPINLHGNDLSIKLALNKLLKIKENLIHLRTFFKQIDPSKFTVIINEAYII